jgi:hypothetical protein
MVIGSPHAFKFVDYVHGKEKRQVPLGRECPQCIKFYDVILPFIEHVNFEKTVGHLVKCSCHCSHYLKFNTPKDFGIFACQMKWIKEMPLKYIISDHYSLITIFQGSTNLDLLISNVVQQYASLRSTTYMFSFICEFIIWSCVSSFILV